VLGKKPVFSREVLRVNDNQRDHVQRFQKKQDKAQGQLTGTSRSWWHSSLVGYSLAVVFAVLAFLIPLSEKLLGIQDYFIEPPFVIATILVGWFWGIGPALLALVLEIFALDYEIIPPLGRLDFFLWPDVASFAPFIFTQLIVLGLVVVQKKYRQQLIESNAQLEQANQVKDQFFSFASHELKTPLTTIRGQTQLILRRLTRQQPLPAEFSFLFPQLERVEAQTYHLQALVNDLLNISSLRSGKMPLQMAPCDFCMICRSVVEDQRALVDRLITLELPADQVVLQIDEGRISQVVSNLVVNAIKYSPVHSTVLVKVSQRIRQVILTVHNDGPAISKEQQAKLFEPFYRTAEAQTSTTEGWGLGLTISKEIVEQHGGRIWVESAEGEGTTFLVELPLPT
jgi:signal transduction histidine kinase